jgi:hypothetical protein
MKMLTDAAGQRSAALRLWPRPTGIVRARDEGAEIGPTSADLLTLAERAA